MADVPESTKMLPCPNPWCDCPDSLFVQPLDKRTLFGVQCECGFEGPVFDSPQRAIAAWDTRAAPPAMDREAVEMAVRGISDDFMTSETHHPGYVLIPLAKFEQLQGAEQSLAATKTPASVRDAIIAAITKADANFGYSYRLTKMDETGEEHTLFMDGFEPAVFQDREDGYPVIEQRRNAARADAILSTLSADAIRQGEGATTANSPVVPDGWKLVPIEPTPEMRQAAIDELSGPTDFSPKASAWDAIRAYRAMLAATPASHASDGGKA